MSGARVFLDEDTQNRLLVEALEAKFVDVLTANDADLANKRVSDAAVLSFASSEERVVVTHNCSDIRALHEASSDHAGHRARLPRSLRALPEHEFGRDR